jgi:hypothetical protein
MIPCSYWALTWIAALPSCITLYEISVRQTRDLPVVSLFPHPASFGFRLTMDTLAFGYILPTTGRIRDFNPLETCAAGRTTQKQDTGKTDIPFLMIFFISCKGSSSYLAWIYPFAFRVSAQRTAPPAAPLTVLWESPMNL